MFFSTQQTPGSGRRFGKITHIAGLCAGLLLAAIPAMAQVGVWNPVQNMSAGRYSPAMTTLNNGLVLVAGGYNGSVTITSAQLFNPTTNTFSTTGSLRSDRNFPTSTLLTSGKVLVAGGYSSYYGTLSEAELYDPSTNAFTRLRYGMNARRELYTGTRLPNGKVLLVGGFDTGTGQTQSSAELFNPSTNSFSRTGSMVAAPYGRFGQYAILLPTSDGTTPTKVLVVGGKQRTPTGWFSLNTAEVYDIPTGTFTRVGDMAYSRDRPTLAWVDAVQTAAGASVPVRKVLVVGGKVDLTGSAYDPTPTEWYDPVSKTFSSAFAPALLHGRMAHTLTPLSDTWFSHITNGGCLAVGGVDFDSTGASHALNTTERLQFVQDPARTGASNPAWGGYFQFVSAGTMADSRFDHGAAVLPDSRVLIAGGRKEDGALPTPYPIGAETYTP